MELLLYEGLSRLALFVRKRGDVADELASAEKVLSHSLLPELVSAVLLDLSGRSLHEADQAMSSRDAIASLSKIAVRLTFRNSRLGWAKAYGLQHGNSFEPPGRVPHAPALVVDPDVPAGGENG